MHMVVVDKRLCLKEGEGEGEVVVRRELNCDLRLSF